MDGVRGACPFGEELRRLRGERGVSLSALARTIHYSKGYLSKIENGGKPPTPDVARRCDEALAAGGSLVRLVADVPAARRPPPIPTGLRPPPEPADAACPYRGLAPFEPHHAPWFFGRERATAELVGRLAERAGRGPLAVVASSGAGKSSLLRAGLVPALRRGALPVPGSRAWPVVVCTPTAHPLKELLRCVTEAVGAGTGIGPESLRSDPGSLAVALRPLLTAGRLVLLVDQFEETFTLCAQEEERRAYVAALCALATPAADDDDRPPPAVVVLGVRADFSGRCLDHPELAAVFSHGLFALGPMTGRELRACITLPAQRAGLALEAGLVGLLLRDAGVGGAAVCGGPDESAPASPGALPLLAHALLVTWQQRADSTLSVAGYETTGGHPRRDRTDRRGCVHPARARRAGDGTACAGAAGPGGSRGLRRRQKRRGGRQRHRDPPQGEPRTAAGATARPGRRGDGAGRLRAGQADHRGPRRRGDHP